MSLEAHLKKISALEKHRDKEREKMDKLLEEKKRIENEIKELEVVLETIDDRLEELEEACLPQQEEEQQKQKQSTIKSESPVVQSTQHEEDEFLTSFSSSTQGSSFRPEELLTDPMTQTQQQPQQEQSRIPAPPVSKAARVSLDNSSSHARRRDDDDDDEITDDLPSNNHSNNSLQMTRTTTSSSTAGGAKAVGQLEITKLPAKKKKTLGASSARIDHFFAPTTTTTTTTSSSSSSSSTNVVQNSSSASSRYGNTTQFAWSNRVDDLLRNTFRIQQFREHQREVINCTLSGRDVFVLMRTGGGKSLTYQLPALLEGQQSGKVTLVISPLLSLIKDQEDQMNQFAPGSAVSFTSNLPGGQAEHTRRWNLVRDPRGGVYMILCTPEKVHKSNKLKSELEKLRNQGRLGRFVVDEAHCSSNWGHDFRPDYTKLGLLRHHFPRIPIMAVTATASDRVRTDVCDILGISHGYEFFRSSSNRPNLTYQVRPKRTSGSGDVLDDMAAFIKEEYPTGAGIVYTLSRKDADTVAGQLCDRGIVAESYHSDVPAKTKDMIHQSWMQNSTQVVVATIAFGLGINKPDVRFVLHHSLSKNLEAYYQESGRAGRDGNPAKCILYYSPKDVIRMITLVYGESGSSTQAFWQMVRYAQEGGGDSVCRQTILAALGEVQPVTEEASKQRRQREQDEGASSVDRRDVGKHAKTVTQLLQYQGAKTTMNMLVKEWRAKAESAAPCVAMNPPSKELSVDDCERVVVSLILDDVFGVNVRYNAYGSVIYLIVGPKGNDLMRSPNPQYVVGFPTKAKKRNGETTKAKARKSIADEDGFLSKKPPAKKGGKASKTRKRKQSATATSTKRKAKASKNQKSTSTRKKPSPTPSELIELSSSDEEEPESEPKPDPVVSTRASLTRKARQNAAATIVLEDNILSDSDGDSDEECEFEG